jgi:hypothetical protein
MLLCVVPFAEAGTGSAQHKSDPNDARGPLDLEGLTFGYSNGRFSLTLDTYGSWASRHLRGPGDFISLRLSRRQASEPRRLLTIDYKRGKLVARIEDTSQGAPAPTIARPHPTRPDANTVSVNFSKSTWGRLGKRIFWEVSVDDRCAACTDVAPDDGTYFVYRY